MSTIKEINQKTFFCCNNFSFLFCSSISLTVMVWTSSSSCKELLTKRYNYIIPDQTSSSITSFVPFSSDIANVMLSLSFNFLAQRSDIYNDWVLTLTRSTLFMTLWHYDSNMTILTMAWQRSVWFTVTRRHCHRSKSWSVFLFLLLGNTAGWKYSNIFNLCCNYWIFIRGGGFP